MIRTICAFLAIALLTPAVQAGSKTPLPVSHGVRIDNVTDFPGSVILWVPDSVSDASVFREPDPAVGFHMPHRHRASPWAVPRRLFNWAWADVTDQRYGAPDPAYELQMTFFSRPEVLRSEVKTPPLRLHPSRKDFPFELVEDVYHITRLDNATFELVPLEAVYYFRDGRVITLPYKSSKDQSATAVNKLDRPVPRELRRYILSGKGTLFPFSMAVPVIVFLALAAFVIARRRSR